MIRFLSYRRHARWRTMLSSYVDGQLTEAEAAEVLRHLDSCGDCREELEALRATVGLLRTLPELDAPRSFAVTRSQLGARTRRAPRIVWATRAATSVAAVLLVVVVLGDVMSVGDGDVETRSDATDMAAPAPARESESAPAPPESPAGAERLGDAAPPLESPGDTSEGLRGMAAVEEPPGDVDDDTAGMAPLPEATPGPPEGQMAAPDSAPTPAPTTALTPEALALADGAPATAGAEDGATGEATTVPTPDEAVTLHAPSSTQAEDSAAGREDGGSAVRLLEIGLGTALAVLGVATIWVARRHRRRSYVP